MRFKKEMIGNAGYIVLSWIMLLLIGCAEEDAIPGATVTAPGDVTNTYFDAFSGVSDETAAPLEFQVLGPDGKSPVPGVTIRFFGGGHVVALINQDGILLNPSDPTFFETKTDDRGLPSEDVYARWSGPACKGDPGGSATTAGPDVTVTGSVEASVGVSFKTWTTTIIVKGCIR